MGNSNRFVSLDIARGIAALIVVLSHWGHFLPKDTPYTLFPQAFYLTPFYQWGWVAVDFFFVLSGFIFFRLYSSSIAENKTSARSFFISRFTRLYPLHFATLISIAGLQYYYLSINGTWFVYGTNDLKSFILHLFFASQWGIYKAAGDSFNGPVWSVSIEILLYISFFLICSIRLNKFRHVLIFSLFGAGAFWFMSRFGRGVMSFYVGGIVYFAHHYFSTNFRKNPILVLAPLIAAWIGYILLISNYHHMAPIFNAPPKLEKKLADSIIVYYGSLITFPLSALTLATFDEHISKYLQKLEFLGNISYSSYLIHFPLQLTIAIFFAPTIENQKLFSSSAFLVAFMITLIILSHITFVCFERPIQNKLRQSLTPTK